MSTGMLRVDTPLTRLRQARSAEALSGGVIVGVRRDTLEFLLDHVQLPAGAADFEARAEQITRVRRDLADVLREDPSR